MSNGVKQFEPGQDPDFSPGNPRPTESPSAQNPPQQMNDGSHIDQLGAFDDVFKPGVPRSIAQDAANAAGAPLDPASELAQVKEKLSGVMKKLGDQGNLIGDQRKIIDGLRTQSATPPRDDRGRFVPQNTVPQKTDFLRGRVKGDDYLTGEQMNDMLNLAVAETGNVIYQHIEQRFQDGQARADTSAAQAALQSSGISPEEQQIIELQHPGLANVDPQNRVRLIVALATKRRDEAAQANVTATETAREGVREQVFVEQSPQVTNVPSSGVPIDLDAFSRLDSAAEMERVLTKMGHGRVNDIGRRDR